MVQTDERRPILYAPPPSGPKHPAAAAIVIPRAGKYRLWVSARDYPTDRPGTRTFTLAIAGKRINTVFGKSGKANYEFEDGGWIELPVGPTLIAIDTAKPFARLHGLILTDNPKLTPVKPITATDYPPAMLHPLNSSAGKAQNVGIRLDAEKPQAILANDNVRCEFIPARLGDFSTLLMAVKHRSPQGWQSVDIDPAAEGYFVNTAPADTKLTFSHSYPMWTRIDIKPLTLEVGGATITTISSRTTHTVAEAGLRTQFIPKSAVQNGNQVRLDFHPASVGQLSATWELLPGQNYASVELAFTPAADGQASLGYEMFFRRDLSKVAELLLPMMYQRKRMPDMEVSLLSNATPVPISLVQPLGESPISLAVVADPRDIPFEWPDGRKAPYALSIRGPGATVQPAIWGKPLGTPGAAVNKGRIARVRFKVIAQHGDWYAAFRTSVDQIFNVRDYRQNTKTSLSDAVLNMIDLFMDDDHGGWWERAGGNYQIESKNGSTHSAPMLPPSLYRLTGDQDILRRRVLPTLAFMLSRDGAHFSPVPEDGGLYPSGSMSGPVKLFGTTTYAGLWELTGRRTPAFLDIASPAGDPRPTAGYSHAAPFDEWLARHQLTNDPRDLAKACEMADLYIKTVIAEAPRKDLGVQPFFFISFVPDWEGLLRLYEITGKQQYLDAATFGARQLMTGLWCHPSYPQGEITVHPTGQYDDQRGDHRWWRGPERFRLGSPRKPGDTPAHEVPAWVVSNVGLGFEQPSTYRSSGDGRLIWQMGWSAHFLRLYRYTKDPAFLTCARNAVIGRWANYPGYYITGFTDLPQSPTYPMTGPDVTDFYYHHIAPHLAWSIDYLVSEAEVLSDGAIAFPSLRQYGYAYFDSRIFGHAPGKVFDDQAAWLLVRRGVVNVDNAQVNMLLASSDGTLHIILTNQSPLAQDVSISAGDRLQTDPAAAPQATVRLGKGGAAPLPWDAAARKAKVNIPARGIATITLKNVKIESPVRPQPIAGRPAEPVKVINSEIARVRAAAIQIDPGQWHGYVWSTATPAEATSATLHYMKGQQWETIKKVQYPFEFLVPMSDERQPLIFKLELTSPAGKTIITPESTLQLGQQGWIRNNHGGI